MNSSLVANAVVRLNDERRFCRRSPRLAVRELALAVAATALGCAETGQEEITVPLFLAGTEEAGSFDATGGVQVTLDRADLAFGPLYLCAGATAGELCETARLEWLDSVVVDTMNSRPERAGELGGVTGPVRSWMFDLGLSSLLTRDDPLVLPAARDLGGVSLRIEGRAEVAGRSLPFVAAVPIQQTDETEQGVPVVRKSQTEVFQHVVAVGEPGLLVRFDPRPWLRDVEFAAFVEDATCTPDGPEAVCAGSVEQTCAANGTIESTRDCRSQDRICVAGEGCVDRITIEPATRAFRSIDNAVVAGARPRFEWGFSP